MAYERKPLQSKICVVCGAEFIAKKESAKCCSSKCRGMFRQQRQPDRACIVCGGLFKPKSKQQKCCSLKCNGEIGKARMREAGAQNICVECGCTFKVNKQHIEKKWCSRRCRDKIRMRDPKRREYVRNYRKENEYKYRERYKDKPYNKKQYCILHYNLCSHCGKYFISSRKNKYCSIECAGLYHYKKNHADIWDRERECPICGNELSSIGSIEYSYNLKQSQLISKCIINRYLKEAMCTKRIASIKN